MFDTEQLQQLFRYACALTANEQSAYDLLQDAVERCLRKPPNKPSSLLGYTRSIIRNQFIDTGRHQQRFPHDELDTDQTPINIDIRSLEDILIDEKELEDIWQLLEPIDREIMFLWAVEEYSVNEISTQLEIPRGTILSRIHRLRKRLKQHKHALSTGECL
ncbi:MAG: RNA polymerase sigma factor [Gammaproteobacteria bacterium]|nr:RNA polymerase sigma factor [Gammaproteobacteria bacterium]